MGRLLKVLQIGAGDFFSTYGGGQVYVKNLVDEIIAQKSVAVSVVSFIASGCGVIKRDYHGVDLWEVGTKGVVALDRIIAEVAPDVIHAHSYKAEACIIGQRKGIPVIVTAHHGGIVCPAGTRLRVDDTICEERIEHDCCLPCVLRNIRTGLWWYPVVKRIDEDCYCKIGIFLRRQRFIPFITPIGGAAAGIRSMRRRWDEVARGCSLMIAPCKAIADIMVKNGLDRSKLKVITHGIPKPKGVPPKNCVEAGDKLKLFYVGRICSIKGIHILLAAFHAVVSQNVELHLIGGAASKQERRYMNELQRQYVSDSRIIWHGKVRPEEVFRVIAGMHVGVSVPTYLEVFGLNIAESMAMGKPVIASRCGGAEMQIRDGENGWLVERNDIAHLKSRLDALIAAPDVVATMNPAEGVKSIGRHVEELIDIYGNVVKEKSRVD